jgi:hypothetical protein
MPRLILCKSWSPRPLPTKINRLCRCSPVYRARWTAWLGAAEGVRRREVLGTRLKTAVNVGLTDPACPLHRAMK